MEQQEKLYDVKLECFNEIKKMADKVKMVEKHLEIVSQTYQRMRDLQAKIVELEEWRSTKKNIPCILLVGSKAMTSVCMLWLLQNVKT